MTATQLKDMPGKVRETTGKIKETAGRIKDLAEKKLPDTHQRVSAHTAPSVNRQIREKTEQTIKTLAPKDQAQITERLRKLDREWDIERVLEMNASSLALAGVILGMRVNRKFLFVPAVVTAFLLQHALQGWCPPLPLFRRLGFRTAREIDEERQALKVARGDFSEVNKLKHRGAASTAGKILTAVER